MAPNNVFLEMYNGSGVLLYQWAVFFRVAAVLTGVDCILLSRLGGNSLHRTRATRAIRMSLEVYSLYKSLLVR